MLKLIRKWQASNRREADYRATTYYAISFLMVVYSLIYVLGYLFLVKSTLGFAINFTALVSYSASVFIIAHRKIKIAKLFQLCTFVLQLLAVTFVFSTRAGYHLYFILVPVNAFLFFEFDSLGEKAVTIGFTIIAVVGFAVCEIFAVEVYSPGISDQMFEILSVSAVALIMIALFFALRIFSIALKKSENQLILFSSTDVLTGAYNRRYFIEHAEIELVRSHRYENPLAILMMDIDHFKAINDLHGHHGGDEVLKALVLSCQDSIRCTDFFARVGGEEFAALLVDVEKENAILIAERIRKKIADLLIPSDNESMRITISIGLAFYSDSQETLNDLLRRADEALYRAKSNGRNRIEYL